MSEKRAKQLHRETNSAPKALQKIEIIPYTNGDMEITGLPDNYPVAMAMMIDAIKHTNKFFAKRKESKIVVPQLGIAPGGHA